jgi:hypothetical protein
MEINEVLKLLEHGETAAPFLAVWFLHKAVQVLNKIDKRLFTLEVATGIVKIPQPKKEKDK